jgi:Family of unknown function (DUF5694)
MKKTITLALLFTLSATTFGQINQPKIKVILLGTFHFGETPDRNKTAFPDLFSPKRQAELDTIANKLQKTGVNKFFLEGSVKGQKKIDDWYALYSQKKMTDTVILRNEILQVAFRTAVLNNAKLVAADSPQELPYDKMNAYEKKHEKDTVNFYPFFDVEYPFKTKQKGLSQSTMSEYYIYLNSLYKRQALMYDYLHYALGYGIGTEYVGEEFALSWYDRNLKIFTNILRNVDVKNDKVAVVLFGASHTAVLRQFFEYHPYFEVVEVEDVLR